MVAGREYLRASRHLLLHTGNTNTRQWNFCSIKTSPLSDRSKIWAGKKVNWTLCNILFMNMITEIKSMIYRLGIGCLFKNESVCDRSTWPASEVPGPSSCLSGRTLSTDQPLFWALHMQFYIICSWTSSSTDLLSIPISFNLLSSILISLRSAASRW